MKRVGIRELALNLSETIALLTSGQLSGPLLVHRDGEPEAIIIRHKSWAPRLHNFTQTMLGDFICQACEPAKVIAFCPENMAVAVEAANQHWRDTHRDKP